MDEDKKAAVSEIPQPSPVETNSVNATRASNRSLIRGIDIYFLAGVIFFGAIAAVGLSSGDGGSGWAGIAGAVAAVTLIVAWIFLRVVLHIALPKASNGPNQSNQNEHNNKRQAVLGLSLSALTILLILLPLTTLVLADSASGLILLVGMLSIPLVSFVSLAALIFCFAALKTPYRKFGIIGLSLQGLVISGIAMAAFLDSQL